MGFRDLDLKREYRTKLSNIASDFLVPVLSETITYKRAVGFFSSSSLAEIAQGVARVAKRNGRIQLVASPRLSEKDVAAISKGYIDREALLKDRVLSDLADIGVLDSLEIDRLNLLANLIAAGILDIRIAFAESKSGMGIYHEKVAIATDENGDRIAFSGSMNESAMAMNENYEAIDVFKSWNDPEERVFTKESAFDAIWCGFEPGVSTFDFPEVKDEIIRKYLIKEPDYDDDLICKEAGTDVPNGLIEVSFKENRPRIPEEYELRRYQKEAIQEWKKRNYRGIYDMATGTGKTVTALASVVELSKALNNHLAVVIVCPFQHLVEQWTDDIRLFNIDPIIAYSGSPQRDWKQLLDQAIRDQKYRVANSEFFCLVCTNDTYASKKVQQAIESIKSRKLIIIDEAHGCVPKVGVISPIARCRL